MSKLNCKATVGCLVWHSDKLVVVYEKQEAVNNWDIPAGSIEPGETPEQAIKRELFEEIGLQTDDDIQLVKIFWATLNDVPTVHFLYETEIDDTVAQTLRPHTPDIQKITSFSRADIQNLIDTKAYEHELAKARLQLFLADKSETGQFTILTSTA